MATYVSLHSTSFPVRYSQDLREDKHLRWPSGAGQNEFEIFPRAPVYGCGRGDVRSIGDDYAAWDWKPTEGGKVRISGRFLVRNSLTAICRYANMDFIVASVVLPFIIQTLALIIIVLSYDIACSGSLTSSSGWKSIGPLGSGFLHRLSSSQPFRNSTNRCMAAKITRDTP